MTEKILMSWSGGKDCAAALHALRADAKFEVTALLTTLTETDDRACMHDVRRELLERQAESVGLPLTRVYVPPFPANDLYERRMGDALAEFKSLGVRGVAFGDLFLEDLRAYREHNLAKIGMSGVYPLWNRDTRRLISEMIEAGFKAAVVCVDLKILDLSFVGKSLDGDFLDRLPEGVDPCGENGEFHTFVHDGPIFRNPIRFSVGEPFAADGFGRVDLFPTA